MKPLLIVDGYNVIGAWKEAEKAGWSMDECRDRLSRLLENYCGYTGEEAVLVFDGYRSDRKVRSEETSGSLTVVFTMQDETADSYIERYAAHVPKYRLVRVATSDGLEQSQVLSTGAVRLTSHELLRDMRETCGNGIRLEEKRTQGQWKRALSGRLPEDTLAVLERLRRSK